MRKFFAFLFIFLLIAAGAGYLLYPTISDQIGQARDGEVMKAYREKTAILTSEQINEKLAEAAAYNDTLEKIEITNPFSAGTTQTSRDYQNRLNIHSGVIGELVIPAIGIYLPVYHNSAETPATAKLIHLESSSLPSDEAGTSIVLAGPGVLKAEGFLGEIGLTDERMLQDLDRLTPGDVLILNVMDRTMVFRIGQGLEEKDAILMLTPGGVRDLDLSQGPMKTVEPTQTPAPTWTARPTNTPAPTESPEPETTPDDKKKQKAKKEQAGETAEETEVPPEETPEPTPTLTPTPTPTPEPEKPEELTLIPDPEAEQLTLLTPWRDQKLLVVRSARIPVSEARELLNSTDRATYPETWKNVLLLGCPVLLVGFIVMFIIERVKRRSYILPDEGRQTARRKKRTKAKLDTLTTEKQEVNHEKTDSENPEPDDRGGTFDDVSAGGSGTDQKQDKEQGKK